MLDHAHGLNEEGHFALLVANRCRRHIDVLFAARCVMQMQDTVHLPALLTHPQWTGLAGLVAGHVEVM